MNPGDCCRREIRAARCAFYPNARSLLIPNIRFPPFSDMTAIDPLRTSGQRRRIRDADRKRANYDSIALADLGTD